MRVVFVIPLLIAANYLIVSDIQELLKRHGKSKNSSIDSHVPNIS